MQIEFAGRILGVLRESTYELDCAILSVVCPNEATCCHDSHGRSGVSLASRYPELYNIVCPVRFDASTPPGVMSRVFKFTTRVSKIHIVKALKFFHGILFKMNFIYTI